MRMMGSAKTTKYEMILRNAEGRLLHLGWTARKTKRCLWLAMMENGPEVLKHADLPDDENEGFEWNTKTKALEWNGFSICFSGETKAR